MNCSLVAACVCFYAPTTMAQAVFDGYQEYYPTLANNVFRQESVVPFKGLTVNEITWRGHRLKIAKALVFPGELAQADELGDAPVLYETQGWACIEGQSGATSGTSVRHFAVFVIDARNTRAVMLFKLPSLFGSCLAVRLDKDGRFLFDSATYDWEKGAGSPRGVIFSEYVIDVRRFIPTGRQTVAEFVEKGNVWKFKLKPHP